MAGMNTSSNITNWLIAWGNGDQDALNKLIPVVYQELHRMAGRYMRREIPDHTLQTSALVNEAYLKLVDQKKVQWQNRAHFFGVASQVMRRVLLDYAKHRARVKRGGNIPKLTLNEGVAILSPERATELIALDRALNSLGEIDPDKSRIVEMKFFGGLTNQEIAEVQNVSTRTIEREWRKAKAWLHREIQK